MIYITPLKQLVPYGCGCTDSPQETLIIFDWDDTVMPSSWVSRKEWLPHGDKRSDSYDENLCYDLGYGDSTFCDSSCMFISFLVDISSTNFLRYSTI